MSFEDLDGGGDDPLADLSLDLFADDDAGDAVAVVEIADLSKAAEAELVMTGDSIETNVCSDIPTLFPWQHDAMSHATSMGPAVLLEDRGLGKAAKEDLESRSPSRRLARSGRDVLYVDIETAPDWDRFDSFGIDRPSVDAKNETPRMMMPTAADTVAMTVDKLKELIARQNPDAEWLDHIAEEEAKGKARKGFLDAIKSGKEAKDSYGKFIKKLSVNPMFCRMVVFGYAQGDGEPVAIPCLSPLEEKICLEKFWQFAAEAESICGFNNREFDLPVILIRSIIHGVSPSIQLDLRKYNSSNVLDLMQILYDGNLSKAMGLKQTCELLGIVVGNDVDGSQVNELVEKSSVENLDKLSAYGRNDVRITQELHRKKLAGYFCV